MWQVRYTMMVLKSQSSRKIRGGTCLNRGCVPSKLLIHSADISEIIKTAHLFGIKIDGYSVDFESIVNRVNDITDSQSNEIKNENIRLSYNWKSSLHSHP